jgi:hypothetical protein
MSVAAAVEPPPAAVVPTHNRRSAHRCQHPNPRRTPVVRVRLGLAADIHGNLVALEAVVADGRRNDVDAW